MLNLFITSVIGEIAAMQLVKKEILSKQVLK